MLTDRERTGEKIKPTLQLKKTHGCDPANSSSSVLDGRDAYIVLITLHST